MFLATDYEGWLTAGGTALAGLAAAGALWFGAVQFHKSGFTFRVRATIDADLRVVQVVILNRGRQTGVVDFIEALIRPSLTARVKTRLSEGAQGAVTLDLEIWPAVRTTTHSVSLDKKNTALDAPVEIPPASSLIVFLMRPAIGGHDTKRQFHPALVIAGDEIFPRKKRWLQVSVGFGDGRSARMVPKSTKGLFFPKGMVQPGSSRKEPRATAGRRATGR